MQLSFAVTCRLCLSRLGSDVNGFMPSSVLGIGNDSGMSPAPKAKAKAKAKGKAKPGAEDTETQNGDDEEVSVEEEVTVASWWQ